ncbi:hypothetical protein N7478_001791 [Penicillium angulare]|uniref:uncharacterized protein n=1 Tax=Penicillium angulare TaxID=116970 RepID=UPI002540EB48|nr:uncharacterized protein N7478_001791 [Penicillium angulare]KAJ5288761.1 hypothetical protein N7478_001791 [Penicillium angulare]
MKRDTWTKKAGDDSLNESYLGTAAPKPKMDASPASATSCSENTTNIAMPEFKLEINIRDSSNITPIWLPPTRSSTLYFCPFHKRHVHHHPEACYINPKTPEQRRINAATTAASNSREPASKPERELNWVAAYGSFRYWESMVYPGTAPTHFVSIWVAALEGLSYQAERRIYSLFPIFQFLKAVSACNETHAWLSSLHIDVDATAPPKAVLESITHKFIATENARLQFQSGPRNSIPGVPNSVENQFPPPANSTITFCHFHGRHAYHSMAECHLNPHRTAIRSGPGSFTPYSQGGLYTFQVHRKYPSYGRDLPGRI